MSEGTEGRCWELCVGNPLLVGQVALALAHGEQLPNAYAGSGSGAAFATMLLLSRFAGLDADGLACARGGSVLGTVFRPELAAELAGLSDERGDAALEALVRSGLVVDTEGAGMRFAHPLFGEALYEDLPAPVRRRLHERAFRVLAGRGQEAEAAPHAVRAELVGDPQAGEVLERVGRSALAAGAIASAVQTLKAAVAVGGERAPPGVSLALAEALLGSGAAADALALAERLLAGTVKSWRERYVLLRLRAWALLLTGQHAAAMSAVEQPIALALDNDQPGLAVESLLDGCIIAWNAEGPGRAVVYARRALDLAADAPTDLRERAQATWGRVALAAGDEHGLAATEFLAERVNTRAGHRAAIKEEFAFPWGTIDQFAYTAGCLTERFEEGERAYRLIQAQAEQAGAVSALSASLCSIAWVLIRRGRLKDALSDVARVEQLFDLFPAALNSALAFGAEALVWLGRFDESEANCRRVEQTAQSGIQNVPAGDTWALRYDITRVRGQRLLWQGDPAAADCFAEVEALTGKAGIGAPTYIPWIGHAVDAYLATDQPDQARRLVEFLEDRIAALPRLPCRGPKIQAHTARAALAARDGDHAVAEERYLAALALHAEIDLPLVRVETLLAYGGFLRRHGRPRDARAPLGEARQLAETLEAAWLAETARRELQLAGGRRRRRTEDRDQLTDAEQHVAELAAGGRTNAEIARQLYLSPSTIETHLRHIYGKLGIGSRRELQALAPGFQPPQPGGPRPTSSALPSGL